MMLNEVVDEAHEPPGDVVVAEALAHDLAILALVEGTVVAVRVYHLVNSMRSVYKAAIGGSAEVCDMVAWSGFGRTCAVKMIGTIVLVVLAGAVHAQEDDSIWSTIEFVDEWEEPTGDVGVASKLVPLGSHDRHKCWFAFESATFSKLGCTYMNIAGSDTTHKIPVKVGETVIELSGTEASGGEERIFFFEEDTKKLIETIKEASESDRPIFRLKYYGEGNVLIKIPLAGLVTAMEKAGLAVESGETQ